MRLKLFAAPTREEAIAAIHAELGLDAIILSELETDDGFEVRAAVERIGQAKIATPDFSGRSKQTPAVTSFPEKMCEILLWHGVSENFARRLAQSGAKLAGHAAGDLVTGVSAALEAAMGFAPIAVVPDRPLMLVGPPGSGKTATAAKLVRRAAAADQRLSAIAADFDATSSASQLAAYLQRPTETITSVLTPPELSAAMALHKAQSHVSVIDTPPINPFDREDLDRLRDLIRIIDAEPVLVLSAEGHPDDMIDAAKAFESLGIRRCILTKLDAVRRRGGAISALVSANINLSHLAQTPFIGGGLIPATPSRLARLLIDDAPGAAALKGAA